MFIKLIKIGLLSSLLFLSGCVVKPIKSESPKNPPTLILFDPNNPLQRQDVLNYQEAILNYITYLEQYYITVGIYYGGNITFPVKTKKDEQCKVLMHIFKDIELPPPPKTKSNLINDTLHSLIDHITDLRRLIRTNNLYMEKLRQQYKKCQ